MATKHGGKRAGAGAKPRLDSPVLFALRIEGSQHRRLKKRARAAGASVSEIVRQAIAQFLRR